MNNSDSDKKSPAINISPASFSPAMRKITGRPPTLLYSLLRLKLDELADLMVGKQWSEQSIAKYFDISRITIKRARALLMDEEFSILLQKAFNANDATLWDKVEDRIFDKFPGFRNQDFYRHMHASIARQKLADKMPEKKPASIKIQRNNEKESRGEGTPEPAAPATESTPASTSDSTLSQVPTTQEKREAADRLAKYREKLKEGSNNSSDTPAP
jgi:hypothetical protein